MSKWHCVYCNENVETGHDCGPNALLPIDASITPAGAGGGQAEATAPNQGHMPDKLLPVDAPGPTLSEELGERIMEEAEQRTDTAADLQRWYCEPWCEGCSYFAKEIGCACNVTRMKPGLLTRCGIRVDGLEWDADSGEWSLLRSVLIPPTYAADLLAMEVVRTRQASGGSLTIFFSVVSEIMCEDSRITLSKAVAIARHRAADAEGRV